MNKKDIVLIIVLLLIIGLWLIITNFVKQDGEWAIVTYENKEILTISLNKDNVYTVKGANGDVVIEVHNHQIRVNEENSPYHYCSKQGYIAAKGESIICLPNKIVVKIVGESSVDVEVK